MSSPAHRVFYEKPCFWLGSARIEAYGLGYFLLLSLGELSCCSSFRAESKDGEVEYIIVPLRRRRGCCDLSSKASIISAGNKQNDLVGSQAPKSPGISSTLSPESGSKHRLAPLIMMYILSRNFIKQHQVWKASNNIVDNMFRKVSLTSSDWKSFQ